MRSVNSFARGFVILCAVVGVFSVSILAQDSGIIVKKKSAMPVVGPNGMYCGGYIQTSPISTSNRIIGGSEEADRYNFTENNFVYINMGASNGVNVGNLFSVVRPKGQVESRWTNKDVGFYVQEVGALEVVSVKSDYSVAKVKFSCSSFLLGDLVQPRENRSAPLVDASAKFDQWSDPSGKANGRILMARDSSETLAQNSIAYVDLGSEENVRVGDRLTVYRPLGKGNLMKTPEKEQVSARDEGFHSDTYRGGKFSNQASRKSGEQADGRMVTTYDAKRNRPAIRKVVGEAIVLNVKERSATVVITQNTQEIHTGDWVEIQ